MLRNLEKTGRPFDSRMVATMLGIQVAEASRDLRRIRLMGFLKRERTARICGNGSRTYIRGYQYSYSLSKQGRSYLRWLRENGYDLALDALAPYIATIGLRPRSSQSKTNLAFEVLNINNWKFKPARPKRLRDFIIHQLADENLAFQKDLKQEHFHVQSALVFISRLLREIEESRKKVSEEKQRAVLDREREVRSQLLDTFNQVLDRIFSSGTSRGDLVWISLNDIDGAHDIISKSKTELDGSLQKFMLKLAK